MKRILIVVSIALICLFVYISKNNFNNLNYSNLILVNYENKIPDNYNPQLIVYNGFKISKSIENDLDNMINDAKTNGYNIIITSAYRSYFEQEEIYNDRYNSYIVNGMSIENAKRLVDSEVAFPGYSEHETGLAVDLSVIGNKDEKEEIWNYLERNSYKYGFINRYPYNKTEITHIKSEPWHFRYVSLIDAQRIYDGDLCLEEYINNNNIDK